MSKFAQRQKSREREEEPLPGNSERRALMGKFFYNIALACFTVMVLGNATPLVSAITGGYDTNGVQVAVFGIGITFVFAYVANRIMKGGNK